MLLPAPRKRAADASATNAISRLYSMRSCPCSSVQKLRRYVILFTPKLYWFGSRDRSIAGLCLRDLSITACTAAGGGGDRSPRALLRGPEHQCDAVVVDYAPAAGFLQRAGQRRTRGQQNCVDAETVQGLLPVVFHAQYGDTLLFEIVAVKIAAAVHKNFGARIKAVNEVVAPLVVGEDARRRIAAQGLDGRGRVRLRIEFRAEQLGRRGGGRCPER